MNKIYLVRHFSFDQSKVLRFEIEIEALKRSKQAFNLSWDSLVFLSQRSVLIFFEKCWQKKFFQSFKISEISLVRSSRDQFCFGNFPPWNFVKNQLSWKITKFIYFIRSRVLSLWIIKFYFEINQITLINKNWCRVFPMTFMKILNGRRRLL